MAYNGPWPGLHYQPAISALRDALIMKTLLACSLQVHFNRYVREGFGANYSNILVSCCFPASFFALPLCNKLPMPVTIP